MNEQVGSVKPKARGRNFLRRLHRRSPIGVGCSIRSWGSIDRVGELSHSVETLTRQGRKHEERLDRISHTLDQISHRIYPVIVVLTVAGAALLWVLNAASDELVAVVREALRQSVE